MYYAALVLQKATTGGSPQLPLYEETVILIEAKSDAEARQKAEAIATGRQMNYRNPSGDLVVWSFERVVDVAPVIDTLQHGAEIYSRHFRNYDDYVRFETLMQRPESKS